MKGTALVTVTALLLLTSVVGALDTTEAFDPGCSDFEMYLGTSGLGLDQDESAIEFEGLLGVGITRVFSASMAYSVESDGRLGNSADYLTLGLFWTVVEKEGFMLDLYGSTGTGGGISIGTEINLLTGAFGFQLNVENTCENSGGSENKIENTVAIEPLVHRNISDEIELLAAVGITYHPDAEDNGDKVEFNTASLGANFMLDDTIELITQFDCYIPEDDGDVSIGFSIGFVATIL